MKTLCCWRHANGIDGLVNVDGFQRKAELCVLAQRDGCTTFWNDLYCNVQIFEVGRFLSPLPEQSRFWL